jgi:hypothetical protein
MTDDTATYIAVTRLQAAYADVVTRQAWSELDQLFLPNAAIHIDTVTRPAIELSGPEQLGEFISGALTRFDFFEFVILNAVVDVTGDRSATGRVYIVEVRHDSTTNEWSNAFGLYTDVYAEDGGWRFAERHYRSLARRTQPSGSSWSSSASSPNLNASS